MLRSQLIQNVHQGQGREDTHMATPQQVLFSQRSHLQEKMNAERAIPGARQLRGSRGTSGNHSQHLLVFPDGRSGPQQRH